MTVRVYDLDTVRAKLTEFVAEHGYRSAAERMGVSRPFLSQVISGARSPSPKVLAVLGLSLAPRCYVEVPRG